MEGADGKKDAALQTLGWKILAPPTSKYCSRRAPSLQLFPERKQKVPLPTFPASPSLGHTTGAPS